MVLPIMCVKDFFACMRYFIVYLGVICKCKNELIVGKKCDRCNDNPYQDITKDCKECKDNMSGYPACNTCLPNYYDYPNCKGKS